MNKKHFFISSFIVISILSIISFGLNMFFLSTKPLSASGIFYLCKNSVVELRAQSDEIGTSFGTAEIITNDGILITNAHVITYKKLETYFTFDDVSIRFSDEQDYRQIDIIKFDMNLDLAVLKLKDIDREFSAIKLGNSEKIKTGEDIYALGNMSNYGLSLTSGTVSIPSVDVKYGEKTRNVIQCDVTISEGNSGGALLNNKGELLGITTFRLKDLSNNIIYGISYCIPINTVMEYINK